jgi:uncharacterized protein
MSFAPVSLANRAGRRIGLLAIVLAAALAGLPAAAQDISDSHEKAARAAITAIHATDRFDTILPAAAVSLKTELLRQNPNLEALIDQTVDEKALAMVSRRADLEREAALAFARAFSEDELKAIAAFYSTSAGKKFIEKGPATTGEVYKAAEIWQRGIVRDLARSVGDAMREKAPPVQDPAATAGTPQQPANPDDAPAVDAPPANN